MQYHIIIILGAGVMGGATTAMATTATMATTAGAGQVLGSLVYCAIFAAAFYFFDSMPKILF